jgi:hypothetical protein
MPMRRELYPADWAEIRTQILARAEGRCEGTWQYPNCRAENGKPHPSTGSRVVLTCAHWPDPTHSNCEPHNLLMLCQRCHLALDRDHHVANARKTRERKRGQARLPECEEL